MTGDEAVRRADRIEILGELRGEVMVYETMVITELSRGGAQIETAFALQIDSLHDFRLVLGDRSVVVKARIAHAHVCDLAEGVTIYRAGVEFVQPLQHVADAIGEFIETIAAQRGVQ